MLAVPIVDGKSRSGFTLVEVLVAVEIVAIIAAIVVPVVSSSKKRALLTVDATQLHQVGLAIAQYTDAHGVFPSSQQLVDEGLDQRLLSSPADRTPNGIANIMLSHIEEEVRPFRLSYSFLTDSVLRDLIPRLREQRGFGLVVSFSGAQPKIGDDYRSFVDGEYQRLLLDTAVVSRKAIWVKTANGNERTSVSWFYTDENNPE